MGVDFWINLVEGTCSEVAEVPVRRWPKGNVWVSERYRIGYCKVAYWIRRCEGDRTIGEYM
jgi:hypothetical protein